MIQQIERQLDRLSRSERQVGEWIVGNPLRAVDASIMQVAQSAGVSEPTVVRFCRSVGVSGFRELRTHLIAARNRPESYLHHDVDAGDDSAAAAAKVLESAIRALVDMRGFISAMPIDGAVMAMRDARQLVFVGLGASGHVAADACHKFFRLGIPSVSALDSPTILQKAAIASGQDVYVVISQLGQHREVVEAMRLASDRGATVIAVTDPHSPLADVASLVMGCPALEDTNVFTPMSSRLVHLTVLDALQVALAVSMGAAAQDNLRLTKQALTRFALNASEGELQ